MMLSGDQRRQLLSFVRTVAQSALMHPLPAEGACGELSDWEGSGAGTAPGRRARGMGAPTDWKVGPTGAGETEAQSLSAEGRLDGVFVTFREGTRLRGCVGSFLEVTDLASALESATRGALSDPRFVNDPITAGELSKLTIEVSLIRNLRPTPEPASLTAGVHGIIVRQGERSGCFLPKVALQFGWSAERFLSECCVIKAGLPSDAWQRPGCEVLLFEAEIVAEDEQPATPEPAA